ncbi:MAG: sulfotransferase family 2 domain-containing protein [Pseudomonadota bacterium]
MAKADVETRSRTAAVFTDTAPGWPAQRAMLARARAAHGAAFRNEEALTQWFRFILLPASGAWAFKPNGKTGTTSLLHALFELEFGVPLTVSHHEPDGILEDHAVHCLAEARVFSPLTALRGAPCALDVLEKALRLTIVRHPLSRALSAFRYLCRADARAVSRFLRERLRMNAITGFDWQRDPDTPDGFRRFLDFVAHELEHQASLPLDWHIGPQVLNVRPEIFQPDLVGRTEDVPAFLAEIAARLDRPLPERLRRAAPRNRAAMRPPDWAGDRALQARVAQVFAADFDAFGYDPAHIPEAAP